METINKIQINGSVKTDALGNILERSTLLNIRTDDVMEAIRLFNQLRVKMNGQEQLSPVSTTNELTADDIFPDEEKPKSYNWPFESNEPAPQCPDCGAQMVKRKSKTGSSFWGCSNFRKGCRGTRQI